jgi:geranylgeranyl pyrophosphate synthase
MNDTSHATLHAPQVLEEVRVGLLSGAAGLLPAVEARMEALALGADGTGGLGAMVVEHLRTGGKRLRACLALAACGALGLRPDEMTGWGAACELLHNASLVHDDLQDGDTMRRGHPTLWHRHGMPQAVNAGDLMLMLPFLAIESLPVDDGCRWRLSRSLAWYAAETARGQSAEQQMLGQSRWQVADWLRVAEGKTAALFGLPVHGAALLAGHAEDQSRALSAPFRNLGLLFQMQDDVLDLYGDKGRMERGADLREGKVSVLVAEHLARRPEDTARVVGILSAARHCTTPDDVAWAAEAFASSGALTASLERIEALSERVVRAGALDACPSLRPVARTLVHMTLQPIRHLLDSAWLTDLAPHTGCVADICSPSSVSQRYA